MRRWIAPLVMIVTLIGVALPAHALTPAHFWSHRFGGTSAETPTSLAVDAAGNVYITGFFNGTANFGGSDLVSAGGADVFLAKYNAAGVHQWSARFGSTSTDAGNALAVDASGNVLLAGYFIGTVDFGGGGLVSAGSREIFLAKYNAAGVHQWSVRFGSTLNDEGRGVAVDATGNAVITGTFTGTVDFGGGGLVSAGGTDIFVAGYNPAGVHQWSRSSGSASNDNGQAVAVDAAGNVFATGFFLGSADFGGGALLSSGGSDCYLAKYNSAGVHQWSQRFGSTLSDAGTTLAVDGSGNPVLAGFFAGTVDFGGGGLISAGSNDIFLAKYSPVGVHQWSVRCGGTSADNVSAVASDGTGNVFFTGSFAGTANFGGVNLASAGSTDLFIAKFSPAGAHEWSGGYGSTSPDNGFGLAVDAHGSALMVGRFQGTAGFGGDDFVSAGGEDIVVAKYGNIAGEPLITSIADIANDQGRQVRIEFLRNGHDDPHAPTPTTHYEAYRRNDAVPQAIAGAALASLSRAQLLDLGWVEVASVHAHTADAYLVDAPTDADSTIALGQHRSVFFVRAASGVPSFFTDSAPDSGYSLDNLAPGAPLNFVYDAGDLTWDESAAADFDFFTVYGSNVDAFGSATVVDYSIANAMDVSGSPYTFYFVTATDFSGNEGKPAKVNTLSSAGESPKSYVLSVSNYPNPFNPSTTVTYTAPSPGEVKVRIYDARGAMVKALFEGHRVAGAYSVEWDGRADNGAAVASGLYFVRIEHASGTRSKKMVLLK